MQSTLQSNGSAPSADATTPPRLDVDALIQPHRLGQPWDASPVAVASGEATPKGLRFEVQAPEAPVMRVIVAATQPAQRAYLRTGHFDVSYEGDGARYTPEMFAFIKRLADVLEANAGQVTEALALLPATTKLPVLQPGQRPGHGATDSLQKDAAKKDVLPFDRRYLLQNVERLLASGEHIGTEAEMILTNPCKMACTFCPQGDLRIAGSESPFDHAQELVELRFQLDQNERLGLTRLLLNGNDVLFHPHFSEIVQYAKSKGFTDIRIMTPGLELADAERADLVARLGVTTVEMPFYGHNEEIQLAMTGIAGAFEKATTAVRNLQARGILPELKIIPISFTLPHLAETAAFVAREFGLPLQVGHYVPHQIDKRHHHFLAPYGQIKPVIAANPELFSPRSAFPLCLYADPASMAGLGRSALNLYALSLPFDDLSENFKPSLSRRFPDVCGPCVYKDQGCPGVYPEYVAQHGVADLHPVLAK